MRIKEFVPPILLRTVKAIAAPRPYGSWADAAAACSIRGYEQANLVNIVFEKTRRFRDSMNTNAPLQACAADTSMLLALALTSARGTLEVIDFGGACGAHYFIAKRVLGEKVRFRWHVVETTAMAKKARDLESDELRFFDDLHRAKQGLSTTDLLFSSGALQYVSQPYDTLKELVNCGAKHIFLPGCHWSPAIEKYYGFSNPNTVPMGRERCLQI